MIQAVTRALSALDYVVARSDEGRAVSLQEVAEHLGTPTTTARNLLRTLEEAGYVCRPGHGQYACGPKVEQWARRLATSSLTAAAEPILQTLASQTGESVVLTTLEGARRRVLLRIEGNGRIAVNASQADLDAFHRLATNRVMVAQLPPADRDVVLAEHPLPDGRPYDDTVGPDGVIEYRPHEDILALAVAILNKNHRPIAAIGLYLPAFRADRNRLADLHTALARAAHAIEETHPS